MHRINKYIIRSVNPYGAMVNSGWGFLNKVLGYRVELGHIYRKIVECWCLNVNIIINNN